MFLGLRGDRGGLGGLGVVTLALLALTLTGCGEQKSASGPAGMQSPTAGPTVDATLAVKVPDTLKADGKLLIGADSTYAPNEFLDTDGKTVIGFDVDLFNAVADKLGVRTEWQTAKFGDIIPGVRSGRYEIGVSSFTVTAERKKAVTMVSYFSAGTQWATQKGNRSAIHPDDACGRKVAVQTGAAQVDDVTARSKMCTDAGRPAITIHQYQAQTEATAAVVSGTDDAMLADSPVSAYAVIETKGQLETLGDIYDAAPYGYAINKDQVLFAEAVRDAVQALIVDGTYKTILSRWGVRAGSVPSSAVDP